MRIKRKPKPRPNPFATVMTKVLGRRPKPDNPKRRIR